MTPHRKTIDKMNARKPPEPKREYVEMLDGRVYYSDDNWQTVYLIPVGGRGHRITGKEADLARFLAVSQSSAGP
ncbi:hypothetical protein NKJ06_18940 [Mesorhizobium sp. M0293]|uniref:hypothetical protein n=1 Tax=Mesorhizobium sp. M0293 TaxID=2956930 RepID=UPI0033371E9D